MPKTVETPDVLTGHAKEIWDAAFLSAYDGTCKEEAEGSGRDGCSAAVAWAAVKEQYKKNEDGEWV
jgi:cation transport regulator